jgi:hypothetical protein
MVLATLRIKTTRCAGSKPEVFREGSLYGFERALRAFGGLDAAYRGMTSDAMMNAVNVTA